MGKMPENVSEQDTRQDFTQLHATSVVVDGVGVLITGPSGTGKSDLALRLMEMQRARLVADDQVVVQNHGDGYLIASPMAGYGGMIEVRGIGIVRYPYNDRALISMVVGLANVTDIDRLPEDDFTEILGVTLPLVRIDPALPSAVARLMAAIRLLCGDGADGGMPP